jgi:uncharacterized metal-binding protein
MCDLAFACVYCASIGKLIGLVASRGTTEGLAQRQVKNELHFSHENMGAACVTL